jgi:translation initiation factor IF-2
LTGRTSSPAPAAAPARPKPVAPAVPEDEAKKETAVMGMPVTTPKPKKDTSRVQVTAAKPAVPEMPRPTVKLKREEPAAAPAAAATAPAAAVAPGRAMAAAPSGADTGLAIGALVLSLAVLGYLASVALS